MKREFLKSLEISDEAIEKIMAENGNDINAAKKQVADLEAQIGTYKQTISDRDKQLDELKKSAGDSEKLQKQIEKLQEENKQAAEKHDAQLKQLKLDNAVDMALTNAKAKNVKAARALLNLENAKMDGDVVKGLDEQIAKLVESDSYLFHVEQKPVIKGAEPAKSSGNANTPAAGSYEYYVSLAESGQI